MLAGRSVWVSRGRAWETPADTTAANQAKVKRKESLHVNATDKRKLFQALFFLNGRVDACQKMMADLQNRIEVDQGKIEEIKQQLKESHDGIDDLDSKE